MAPPIGFVPWNKNKKGIHLSPETEFKKGTKKSPYAFKFEKGEKHPRWKGGYPRCLSCEKTLGNRYAKRCNACNGKTRRGTNHPNWKGGVSKDRGFYGRKRRARKASVGGKHTYKDWIELKLIYKNACANCKKKEPKVFLTVDHIIPLSKGGSNNIDNIQPLCGSCNSKKHDKTIRY